MRVGAYKLQRHAEEADTAHIGPGTAETCEQIFHCSIRATMKKKRRCSIAMSLDNFFRFIKVAANDKVNTGNKLQCHFPIAHPIVKMPIQFLFYFEVVVDSKRIIDVTPARKKSLKVFFIDRDAGRGNQTKLRVADKDREGFATKKIYAPPFLAHLSHCRIGIGQADGKQVFRGHPSRKGRKEEALHNGEIKEEDLFPRVDAVINYCVCERQEVSVERVIILVCTEPYRNFLTAAISRPQSFKIHPHEKNAPRTFE
jgi:hypothetical protein